MPGVRMVRSRGDEVLPSACRLPAKSGPYPAVASADVLPGGTHKRLMFSSLWEL